MDGYGIKVIYRENIFYFDLVVLVLGEECVNKYDNRYFKYIFRGDC